MVKGLLEVTTCLSVFTCNKGNAALQRHWPCFLRQQADSNYVIATENTHCEIPEGASELKIGVDDYINGAHLPRRLIDSISRLLDKPWDVLMLAEYDTVIFNRIRVEAMEHAMAAHLAGHMPAYHFYHNPWVLHREVAEKFIQTGETVIRDGVCSYGSIESSPDVFFGLVCFMLKMPIQHNLWREFSRNSMTNEGDLELAKACYRDGYDVIHGIKTKEELEYITNGQSIR